MGEMWGFVGDKVHQCWLWWAIDHTTGEPLAFHFGTREYNKLVELVNTYEPRIIMANSEAEFESRFREFLANADQIGVGKLETFMTNRVKQIKPQYR
ncbi:MAG: hypothetical protein LBF74_09175 [Treponema sp.]|nr:hypothetical protein [Treponema sp.]